MLNVLTQRHVAHNTELRRWRLEQLRPTQDFANAAMTSFLEMNLEYQRAMRLGDEESLKAFEGQVVAHGNPARHLGHTIMVSRIGTRSLQRSLNSFLEAHGACMSEMIETMERSRVATALGRHVSSIMPSETNLYRLMDSELELNQAVELYGFGRSKHTTMAELEHRMEILEKLLPPWVRPRRADRATGEPVSGEPSSAESNADPPVRPTSDSGPVSNR